MYMHKETKEFGLSASDIMSRHPSTSFAIPFEPLPEYVWYADAAPPEHDADSHKAVEIEPVEQGGEWVQQWEIVPLTESELHEREQARIAAEQAAREAARVTISRTQGLVYLYDALQVTEGDVQALIDGMEDTTARYKAGLYFRAATWDSDNVYVAMLAAAVGLDSPAKLEAAFRAAKSI